MFKLAAKAVKFLLAASKKCIQYRVDTIFWNTYDNPVDNFSYYAFTEMPHSADAFHISFTFFFLSD